MCVRWIESVDNCCIVGQADDIPTGTQYNSLEELSPSCGRAPPSESSRPKSLLPVSPIDISIELFND